MFSVIAAYQFSFIWNIILILEKWLWLGLGATRVGMNKPLVIIWWKTCLFRSSRNVRHILGYWVHTSFMMCCKEYFILCGFHFFVNPLANFHLLFVFCSHYMYLKYKLYNGTHFSFFRKWRFFRWMTWTLLCMILWIRMTRWHFIHVCSEILRKPGYNSLGLWAVSLLFWMPEKNHASNLQILITNFAE